MLAYFESYLENNLIHRGEVMQRENNPAAGSVPKGVPTRSSLPGGWHKPTYLNYLPLPSQAHYSELDWK